MPMTMRPFLDIFHEHGDRPFFRSGQSVGSDDDSVFKVEHAGSSHFDRQDDEPEKQSVASENLNHLRNNRGSVVILFANKGSPIIELVSACNNSSRHGLPGPASPLSSHVTCFGLNQANSHAIDTISSLFYVQSYELSDCCAGRLD